MPHLKRVILHLARSKDYPTGSALHGYEFVAPLDSSGHIDTSAWKRIANNAKCDDSGRVKPTNTASFFTNPAAVSMRVGCSTTIAAGTMTTKRAIALAPIALRLANISPYVIATMTIRSK